jgi:hypothetical protein
MKIKGYIHNITKKVYSAEEYNNHGYGGVYRSKKDLPKDGYPYKVIMI